MRSSATVGLELLEHLQRSVGRSVVDDDDLEVVDPVDQRGRERRCTIVEIERSSL